MMKYSICLIVPTIGRVAEVERLFHSLENQTCKDFQVVLVDQNRDDRLNELVNQYSDKLNLLHVKDKGDGAAHARNVGFEYCDAEVVLWPDDDSWYSDNLIMKVNEFFSENHETEGVIGYLFDESDRPHSRWYSEVIKKATLMDAFILGAEPVLGFRYRIFKKLEGFDEDLGAGAYTPWGAGEGTDLCIRAIQNNYLLIISPFIKVFHRKTEPQLNNTLQIKKARDYSRGMGAVLIKNNLSFLFLLRYTSVYIRSIIWNLLKFNIKNAYYHKERFCSLIEGYINYKNV